MIAVAEATIILCTFEGNGNGLNVNCYSDIDCPSTGNKRMFFGIIDLSVYAH